MRINFQSKGNLNRLKDWLTDVVNKDPTPYMYGIAEQGVQQLSANTPKDSGETASSWKAEVKRSRNGADISWVNTAHPELDVNLAKLIELGHGTRNGGYVPPQPYIDKAMDSIWDNAGDIVSKELIK